MDIKEMILDLFHQAKALKASINLYAEAFTEGTMQDQILAIMAKPETYCYAMYQIENMIDDICKKAEALEDAAKA